MLSILIITSCLFLSDLLYKHYYSTVIFSKFVALPFNLSTLSTINISYHFIRHAGSDILGHPMIVEPAHQQRPSAR